MKCGGDENLFEDSYYSLACEQREGKERGRRKRELVGMGKDIDFRIPAIYVMFKLTIRHRVILNFEP